MNAVEAAAAEQMPTLSGMLSPFELVLAVTPTSCITVALADFARQIGAHNLAGRLEATHICGGFRQVGQAIASTDELGNLSATELASFMSAAL